MRCRLVNGIPAAPARKPAGLEVGKGGTEVGELEIDGENINDKKL